MRRRTVALHKTTEGVDALGLDMRGARRQLPRYQALAPRECPSQESNLVFDLRKVACVPAHSEDILSFSSPPRNRTPSCRIEVCRAIQHTRRPCRE